MARISRGASASRDSERKVRTRRRTTRKDNSRRRDAHLCLRWDWWRKRVQKSTTAQFREDEQIEEVHPPEHQEHHTDFAADHFQHFAEIRRCPAFFQGKSDIPYVDEIKSNNQKVIYGIRQ